jgi:hypothetical protein
MITVNFDSSIYSAQAIKKAIRDYRALADLSLQKKNNFIVVKINNIENTKLKPLFAQEFSNYVLSLVGALK